MMRKRDRGLSLAEMLIAFVLVLLLLLYTISSFVSSNRYIKRGKEYSTALFLSQSKMEALQVTPMADLSLGEGHFEGEFERYAYTVELLPWEDDIQQLQVHVTSPRGAVARISTLRQVQTYQGIVADQATNTVVYSKPGSSTLFSWDDKTNGPRTQLPKPLPGGEAGALAGFPGWNLLWAADMANNTLVPYKEADPEPWGTPVSFPNLTDQGFGPTRIAGICMDVMGNFVFAADWSNRGVWIYTDGLPGLPVGFHENRPHAPVSPPLGIPSGVATDPAGSVVLVADTENQCLRKLFVNLGSPTSRPDGYDSEDLERAPKVGYWLKERMRHPQGMGAPQGVALNSTGWVAYTVDRAYLYQMIESQPGQYEWKRFRLDPELAEASPSGLTLDEFNNLIFLVTKNGELWKYHIPSNDFDRLDQ